MKNKPKVLAYIVLHYGKDFLSEAIKSVHNHADKIIVLYSQKPSFGHATDMACPDSREELRLQALNTSHKCVWIDTSAANEGDHTNQILEYSQGYDLLLRFDADEIYDQEELAEALEEAFALEHKYFGFMGFLNFYRSFNTVCTDYFAPIRIIKPSGTIESPYALYVTTYHFSLCQRDEIIRYKWSGLHGHQDELREGWLENKYFNYQEGMTDLHPVAIDLWKPEFFDKNKLPHDLLIHPYFNLNKMS